MASFISLRAETQADQRLYLDNRLAELECLDCLAKVMVKKNSAHHTAVQWSDESVGACAEFARRRAESGHRAVYESCSRLKASIESAVREGRLQVGDTDGSTDLVAAVSAEGPGG
jgi:hypothetical protein